MTEKEKRSQRRSTEDAAFNRMLLWLLGAVVAELIVLLVKRLYVDFGVSDVGVAIASGLSSFFQVFQFVGLALLVVCVIWWILNGKAGRKVRAPAVCTGVVLFLWVVTLLAYHLYATGVRILMVLPAVAAVLILIFFLYQRAFFVNAILTGGGMAALWLYRQYYMTHPTVITACFVAGWVALAAAAALAWRLKKSDGRLGKLRVMPEKTNYLTAYLTCVITAAAMLLGFLLGGSAAYYLLFVLIGWLFCQAVYFTVKLM